MNRHLLDTSALLALLALRDDEAGAGQIADVLSQARQERAKCYGCFMSLMEVLYRVWNDENEQEGRFAYQQCVSLPIIWIPSSALRNNPHTFHRHALRGSVRSCHSEGAMRLRNHAVYGLEFFVLFGMTLGKGALTNA
jgi:hypothetical protein